MSPHAPATTDAPSPFLTGEWAKLQWALDATSIRALQFCPRSYQLGILEGWRGDSVDLEFGVLYHSAVEAFVRARLAGKSKEEAQREAVRYAYEESVEYYEYRAGFDQTDIETGWEPKLGRYHEQWRCLGEKPYKNEKGNRAKCPLSHAGVWQPTAFGTPDQCNICGSGVQVARNYVPQKKGKGRPELIRLIAWWTEEQPEDYGMQPRPYAFPDGTPAVELGYRLPLPLKTPMGTNYMLVGYMDRIERDDDFFYVVDTKTTTKTLGRGYFAQFTPNIQVTTYDFAASVMFPDLPFHGVKIDAAQTMVTGAAFAPHIAHRNEGTREEYLRDLEALVREAESYVRADYWPKREANCMICGYKAVCALSPEKREAFLQANYQQRFWNPLVER